MIKRLGECEYCGVPIMDDDYHCMGCGAPAISRHDVIKVPDPNCYGQLKEIHVAGGIMPKRNPLDWYA